MAEQTAPIPTSRLVSTAVDPKSVVCAFIPTCWPSASGPVSRIYVQGSPCDKTYDQGIIRNETTHVIPRCRFRQPLQHPPWVLPKKLSCSHPDSHSLQIGRRWNQYRTLRPTIRWFTIQVSSPRTDFFAQHGRVGNRRHMGPQISKSRSLSRLSHPCFSS